MPKILSILIITVFISSCSTFFKDSSILDGEELTKVKPSDTIGQSTKIRSGEKLTVSIRNIPTDEQQNVNGIYSVDEFGKLRLPYLSEHIPAAGLTYGELEEAAESAYLRNGVYSDAFIEVREGGGAGTERTVTVSGYASSPGLVTWNSNLKLIEALSQRGGPNRFGTRKRVFLQRRGKVYECDMGEISHQNIFLQPGDVIEVPKRHF